MYSRSMRSVYNRLLILGLLSACLFVFVYTDVLEDTSAVSAALCTVDCDDSYRRCNDACDTSCAADSTDPACLSCVTSCTNQWDSCLSRAVTCSKAPSYSKRCDVNFSRHCLVDSNGVQHCDTTSGGHDGYSEVCTQSFGFQCVACPDHEYCSTGSLPPCF
jgi:hypothetical protein